MTVLGMIKQMPESDQAFVIDKIMGSDGTTAGLRERLQVMLGKAEAHATRIEEGEKKRQQQRR